MSLVEKKSQTIRDIAREANVSVATVSRLINQTGQVAEDTSVRVQAIIDKYGFRPNALARSLFMKKSKMIGLMIPDITNMFFAEICLEVEKAALELGYSVFLCNSINNSKLESRYLEQLTDRQVDGVILVGGRINQTTTNQRFVTEMKKLLSHIPLVMINGKMDGMKCYQIHSDEYQAMLNMTEYLVALGHHKIGLIGGLSGITSYDMKMQAFLEASRQQDFQYRDEWMIMSEFSIEGGIQSMQKMLLNQELPTAVIAINDLVAFGAIKVCNQNKISIPEDLSMIGFDDIELARVSSPALTTVAHPYDELGQKAVQTIDRLVNGQSAAEDILLDTRLVIRDSCCAPRK